MKSGAGLKRSERPQHRLARGFVNIQRIHFLGGDRHNLPGQGFQANLLCQRLALAWCELLGIIDAGDGFRGVKDDRGGVKRAKQSAAPGFVTAGNQAPALALRQSFEAARAAKLARVEGTRHGGQG